MGNESLVKDATNAIQAVDVSEIITSLALGIAKAQEKLDDNSIKQLLRLSTQQVGGMTLLQLGFAPAFYAFDYADVNASIHLKMVKNNKTEFGIKAKLDFAKTKGYSSEHVKLLEDSKTEKKRSEFKCSKAFLVKCSEKKAIRVQNRTLSFDQTEGSVTKVENFEQRLREAQHVSRAESEAISQYTAVNQASAAGVSIQNVNGYVCIHIPQSPAVNYGILKITEYMVPTPNIPIVFNAASSFSIGANYQATLSAASAFLTPASGLGQNSRIIGFQRRANAAAAAVEVYYGYDIKRFDAAYSEGSYTNQGAQAKLDLVAAILLSDPTARVSITGHTDSSGTVQYNDALGKKRAQDIADYLKNRNVPAAQLDIESAGETEAVKGANGQPDAALDNIRNPRFRKTTVSITNADYIYVEGTGLDIATAEPAWGTGSKFGFVKLVAGASGQPSSQAVHFLYNTTTINLAAASAQSFLSLFRQNAAYSAEFDSEVINETVYLLHNESKLRFVAYSLDMEEMEMEEVKESSSSNSQESSSYLIDETVNSKYMMERDTVAIKDPSTLAVSASVDFRMAREFGMTLEGNASVTARLRSVPPPHEFKAQILDNATVTTTGTTNGAQ